MGEIICAEVADYNNGTYMICFAALQVKEIESSVFVNGHEIKGSHFKIMML